MNQSQTKFFKIVMLVASLTLTPIAGRAQDRLELEASHIERTEVSTRVVAIRPRPLPITGTPDGNRTGGGTRPAELPSRCRQTAHPPTALVPEDGKGATAVEFPTLWFYIPYTNQDIDTIEFSLHDQNDTTTLYRSSIQLVATPGVINVALPVALEMNETYQWRLVINCEPDPSGYRDFALDGWIMRTTPNTMFEWDGVWYDALTDVATRYRSDPQNTALHSAWVELLEHVGLSDLASDPILFPF